MKQFELTLKSSKELAPNVKHFVFTRNDGETLDFIPGHFITFHLDAEQGLKRRSYSIATIPGQTDDIEIAISYVDGGIASKIFFDLNVGDSLNSSGPFGRLILRPAETPRQYVLVATGTGVAPYRAMLPEISKRLEADDNLQVHVLLGVQYRQDLLYADDFIAFAEKHQRFHFHALLSRDELNDQKDYEHKGYVQSHFTTLNLDPDEDLVYLCGNPNMIDDAFAYLGDEGFSPKSVRREKYISSN